MQLNLEHQAHYLGMIPNVTIMPMSSAQSSSPLEGGQSPHNRSPSRSHRQEQVMNFENGEEYLTVDSLRTPDISIPPRPSEVQLIDRIETAQLEGRLPYSYQDEQSVCPTVKLYLSKHGLKMVDAVSKEVLERLPLHKIAQSVSYDDGLGHWNVAVKVGQLGKNMYACYVFQTRTEEDAVNMSNSLHNIFQAVIQQQN